MTKKISNKRVFDICAMLIIMIACYLVINTILRNDNYALGGDGVYHASLINGYYQSFLDGNFFPRGVLPNIGYDLGYGNAIFYQSFWHYISALVAYILPHGEYNVYEAMYIVQTCSLFLSGLVVYILSIKLFKNRIVALVTSIIYIYQPYHSAMIYTLSWVGSIWLYVFIPVVILSLYYLINKNRLKFLILFVIGVVGMVYSHLMMSAIIILLIFPFILFYSKDIFKKENIKVILMAVLLIFLLTSPITLNFLYLQTQNNFPVFDTSKMTSVEGLQLTSMPTDRFYYFSTNGAVRQIDVSLLQPVWLMLVASIITFFLYNKRIKKLFLVGIITGAFFLYMVSDNTPIPNIELLHIIQFPHRLMIIPNLIISLLAPLFISVISIKLIGLLISFVLMFNVVEYGENSIGVQYNSYQTDMTYAYGKEYLNKPPQSQLGSFRKDSLGVQHEYLPNNFNLDGIETRKAQQVKVISGEANINIINDKVNQYTFDVSDVNGSAKLELPLVYYDGYRVYCDGKRISNNDITDDNGLVNINIDQPGQYKVRFVGNKMYRLGIRLMEIGILIFTYVIYRGCYERKNKRES